MCACAPAHPHTLTHSPPPPSQVLQEFGVKYILNVTTKCPNYHEGEEGESGGAGFVYKRIAVTDTGTQKLSQHFEEAFHFIGGCGWVGGCVCMQCVFVC